jgi:hypothetical protein
MKSFILILSLLWIVHPGSREKSFQRSSYSGGVLKNGDSLKDTSRYVYVGAEACAAKCHNNDELGYQYDSWKNSRHSKAWESLSCEKAFEYSKNAGIAGAPGESPVCLKCHVTAWGFESASLGATYKKEDGVTCESCHKGEFIPKTFLPDEKECLICHNNSVHEVATFDFSERCLRISHPRPKTKKV